MMNHIVRTRIIKIGNAKGIRIPQPLLDQLGLSKEVEVAVQRRRLVIRPRRRCRVGWAKQFRAMAKHGDDRLLDTPLSSLTQWDTDEWQW